MGRILGDFFAVLLGYTCARLSYRVASASSALSRWAIWLAKAAVRVASSRG